MNRRDFIQKSIYASCGIAVASLAITSCSKPAPYVPPTPPTVNFTIDISTPQYNALQTKGNFLYDNGLIIARDNSGNFIALFDICPHAGCTVQFDGVNQFPCPCHGSAFDESGNVVTGPATTALKKYNTQLAGNQLHIWG